jgi:hypothetical protein
MTKRFDLIRLEDGQPFVMYGSESDLRDALHAYADSYGWNVKTEVHVPGWGRIDLLIRGAWRPWVIELKVAVSKPALLRRGLTQVHGYAASVAQTMERSTRSILCAPKFPDWAQEMASTAYPDIELITVSELMGELDIYSGGLRERASDRLRAAEHEAEVRRNSVAAMPRDDDEEDVIGGVITPEHVETREDA